VGRLQARGPLHHERPRDQAILGGGRGEQGDAQDPDNASVTAHPLQGVPRRLPQAQGHDVHRRDVQEALWARLQADLLRAAGRVRPHQVPRVLLPSQGRADDGHTQRCRRDEGGGAERAQQLLREKGDNLRTKRICEFFADVNVLEMLHTGIKASMHPPSSQDFSTPGRSSSRPGATPNTSRPSSPTSPTSCACCACPAPSS